MVVIPSLGVRTMVIARLMYLPKYVSMQRTRRAIKKWKKGVVHWKKNPEILAALQYKPLYNISRSDIQGKKTTSLGLYWRDTLPRLSEISEKNVST